MYDHNEVVLNAKKFDNLYKKIQFNSTDDLDEIGDLSSDQIKDLSNADDDALKKEEKKTYTGTINSKEFRQYLKDKGLILLPAKVMKPDKLNPSSNKSDGVEKDQCLTEKTFDRKNSDPRKTVFRRLSNIFLKNKTAPTPNETLSSSVKRVVLNDDNRSVRANDEFINLRNYSGNLNELETSRNEPTVNKKIQDIKTIESKSASLSSYRKIDLSRSRLHQTIGKNIKEPIVPSGTSSKQRTSLAPMQEKKYSNYFSGPEKLQDNYSDSFASTSQSNQKNLQMDPFTFAKIQEIKKKTDEVLLNDSVKFNDQRSKIRLNNISLNRYSIQRSTISGFRRNIMQNEKYYNNTYDEHREQPIRSQSVLDNMTCFENSLYGEVSYRQPDGKNINVIMRRPDSNSLDKKQIMQKIYEYYRKSVNNTPERRSTSDSDARWDDNGRSAFLRDQSSKYSSFRSTPRYSSPGIHKHLLSNMSLTVYFKFWVTRRDTPTIIRFTMLCMNLQRQKKTTPCSDRCK